MGRREDQALRSSISTSCTARRSSLADATLLCCAVDRRWEPGALCDESCYVARWANRQELRLLKALETCAVTNSDQTPAWHKDKDLMAFLSSL